MTLATFLDILFLVSLFKIKLTKPQLIKATILTGVSKLCFGLILKSPFYIIPDMLVSVLVLHFMVKMSYEKSVLAETINVLIMVSTKLILVKLMSSITPHYIIISEIIMAVIKGLMIVSIRFKEIHIILGDHLQNDHKTLIYVLSTFGIVLAISVELYTSQYLINILTSLLYVYILAIVVKRIELAEAQALKIDSLEMYNKTLLSLYEKLKSFRHDFANFALALDGYAKVGNIDGVKRLSKTALDHCNEVNRIGVLSPEIIDNPAVFTILTNKFYHAQEQGITMNIEILDTLSDQESNSYEVCRILGILLDNAIEAAKSTEEKLINVRFIKDLKQNRKLIVIENSYNNKTVDVSKIFEKGYTSKDGDKESHGIGLWNIKSILMKNEYLNLYTTADELFRQQLEIY